MEKKLEELSDCIFVKTKRQENNVTSDSLQQQWSHYYYQERACAESVRETWCEGILEQLSLQDQR